MSVYIVLIVIVDVLILIGMTVHGAHKGFAKLFSGAVSLLIAAFAVIQISGLVNNAERGSGHGLLTGILMLIILGIIYKIVRIILSSIRFLSRLPVLSGLDKVLGVAAGFGEGFIILYVGEYLLRMYLLR